MSTHAPIYDFGIVLEPLLPYLNKSAIELFPDAYALSPETKAICHFSNDKFIKMAESEELPEFFDDFIDDSPLYEILVKNLGSDNIRRIPCFEGEVHTAPDVSAHNPFSQTYDKSGIDAEHILYFRLKQPRLFSSAYTNPQEIIEEFTKIFAKYLRYVPKDFDFNRLICTIVGTTSAQE